MLGFFSVLAWRQIGGICRARSAILVSRYLLPLLPKRTGKEFISSHPALRSSLVPCRAALPAWVKLSHPLARKSRRDTHPLVLPQPTVHPDPDPTPTTPPCPAPHPMFPPPPSGCLSLEPDNLRPCTSVEPFSRTVDSARLARLRPGAGWGKR